MVRRTTFNVYSALIIFYSILLYTTQTFTQCAVRPRLPASVTMVTDNPHTTRTTHRKIRSHLESSGFATTNTGVRHIRRRSSCINIELPPLLGAGTGTQHTKTTI
ncbi:hypothetical protein NP493_79g02027 [Ridgeia piscesae]|uniref:Uncharacterized protein n=1 Tax=Ridgeia piscesae TaxID=27915 RepID=A0AAD9UI04_RIDPI|nr:hypothetical protein NP493_79g02027 [Ridgeia piscesae]